MYSVRPQKNWKDEEWAQWKKERDGYSKEEPDDGKPRRRLRTWDDLTQMEKDLGERTQHV